jgi:hypothetical protein
VQRGGGGGCSGHLAERMRPPLPLR